MVVRQHAVRRDIGPERHAVVPRDCADVRVRSLQQIPMERRLPSAMQDERQRPAFRRCAAGDEACSRVRRLFRQNRKGGRRFGC
jgi:hypothetical protein